MLLQHIVQQLDAELDRLHSLRKLVVTLQRSPVAVRNLDQQIHDAVAPAPEAAPVRELVQKPRHRGRPRKPEPPAAKMPSKRRTSAPPEPSALTSAIPAGPVVISAAALARERTARQEAAAAAHEASLAPESNPETMVQDLTARWLSGSGALSA